MLCNGRSFKMSRQLIPRPLVDGSHIPPLQTSLRPKKISTACGACKARKTRCSGGNPCDACATRDSQCVYDATSDQRRKVANQRNIHELENTQRDLERHQELLGGIIATVRAGDFRANNELIQLMRTGVDLSQLAAHVRNELRSNIAVQRSFETIEFIIDGPKELPSPTQILSRPGPPAESLEQAEHLRTLYEQNPELEPLFAEDVHQNMMNVDPTL